MSLRSHRLAFEFKGFQNCLSTQLFQSQITKLTILQMYVSYIYSLEGACNMVVELFYRFDQFAGKGFLKISTFSDDRP